MWPSSTITMLKPEGNFTKLLLYIRILNSVSPRGHFLCYFFYFLITCYVFFTNQIICKNQFFLPVVFKAWHTMQVDSEHSSVPVQYRLSFMSDQVSVQTEFHYKSSFCKDWVSFQIKFQYKSIFFTDPVLVQITFL